MTVLLQCSTYMGKIHDFNWLSFIKQAVDILFLIFDFGFLIF